MRYHIVPGAVFPNHELSDHRGKHRTLPELQEGDPPVLVLSTEISVQKDRRTTQSPPATQLRGAVGCCHVTISRDAERLETEDVWRCATLCGYARRGENAWEV